MYLPIYHLRVRTPGYIPATGIAPNYLAASRDTLDKNTRGR